jgi:hypothetical protein
VVVGEGWWFSGGGSDVLVRISGVYERKESHCERFNYVYCVKYAQLDVPPLYLVAFV